MTENTDVLIHYGILRRSGRYPWGSGGTLESRSRGFLNHVAELRKQGVSDTDIARGLKVGEDEISTTAFRAAISIARDEVRRGDAAEALRLQDRGLSTNAIAKRMGKPESTVRSMLNPAMAERRDILQGTAKMLQDKVDKGAYLDVGRGVENELGISKTRLATSVAILKEKGYVTHSVQTDTLQTGKKTTILVLAPPGTTYVDVKRNPERIQSVKAYSEDKGRNWSLIDPPVNISSDRVAVRWAEEGGTQADGVIYVRRGVPDVSLGKSSYAQVRIAVDGSHYLKGMAMYKDNMPPGADLIYNTNKPRSASKHDAMKPQADEANPFGSSVRQYKYTGKDGKQHQSVMNIVNEEGDWRDWSKSLSSQVLSKQSTRLAKDQLGFALRDRLDEFDEISRLTNPDVKRKLLETFADKTDSAAVNLKAAALPRQRTHVILPLEGIRPGEIYAPNYNNGDKVALIRHPHGGTFEIPELIVNNRSRTGRSVIGPQSPDAVGIHPSVAHRLSGADFDGDTVLVIPNPRGKIKSSAPLADLKNFDPQSSYPPYHGMRTIDGGTWNSEAKKAEWPAGKKPSGRAKQQQMGDVSNLITDMTIKGAQPHEIAQAVRHSMVVIDAEKHHLDVKRSYQENGIALLKKRYQGVSPTTGRLKGASTLISRAGAEIRVPQRRPRPARLGGPINPVTGQREFQPTGATFRKVTVTKTKGARIETVDWTTSTKRLAEEMDARKLISDERTPIEEIYAAHSNSLKQLANRARLESLSAGKIKYSPSAAKAYEPQVRRLNAALNEARKNAPRERQAQLISNTRVSIITRDNPGMDADAIQKLRGQSLIAARQRVGAHKEVIDIKPDEWTAIQSGAITSNRLKDILDNADLDKVKKLATPRTATVMTPARMSLAKAKMAAGYTTAEIASSLGIPVSTLESALKREVA